jgi:hypothetical protein
LQLSELFGVTTDYLIKDEIEQMPEREIAPVDDGLEETVRRVSMEEAVAFLAHTEKAARMISTGVMTCILSPVLLIFLTGAAEMGAISLSTTAAEIVGTATLLCMVAAAVGMFIMVGLKGKRFEYLDKLDIDTEYGVTGMVKERRAAFERTFTTGLTVGIILCVLSVIPILTGIFTQDDLLAGIGVCVMLAMCAAGVWLIVRVCIEWGSYQKLLEEGDYTRKTKLTPKGWLSGAYWSLATAVFLAYSFWTKDWANSWIIWPVAGVLYAVVAQIERGMMKK